MRKNICTRLYASCVSRSSAKDAVVLENWAEVLPVVSSAADSLVGAAVWITWKNAQWICTAAKILLRAGTLESYGVPQFSLVLWTCCLKKDSAQICLRNILGIIHCCWHNARFQWRKANIVYGLCQRFVTLLCPQQSEDIWGYFCDV